VGEPIERMHETLRDVAPALDPDRPRYLMGVGTPRDLVLERSARASTCSTASFPRETPETGRPSPESGRIVIKQARWRDDPPALDEAMLLRLLCGWFLARIPAAPVFGRRDPAATLLLSLHNLALLRPS
jgi:queuine tRNA-ribosyltransferase